MGELVEHLAVNLISILKWEIFHFYWQVIHVQDELRKHITKNGGEHNSVGLKAFIYHTYGNQQFWQCTED